MIKNYQGIQKKNAHLPLSPGSCLVTSCRPCSMLSSLVTSIMKGTTFFEHVDFRSDFPFSVKHAAKTWKPKTSRRFANLCPKPESHPVMRTYLSLNCVIFCLYRYDLRRKYKTKKHSPAPTHDTRHSIAKCLLGLILLSVILVVHSSRLYPRI